MELGLKPSEHKGNISPFGSCLTECGICGPLCNSSGRELKRKRKRKDCKSSHREVTCLSASQFQRPGYALMLAFCRQPSLTELLSRKYGLIKKCSSDLLQARCLRSLLWQEVSLYAWIITQISAEISVLTCGAASRGRETFFLKSAWTGRGSFSSLTPGTEPLSIFG